MGPWSSGPLLFLSGICGWIARREPRWPRLSVCEPAVGAAAALGGGVAELAGAGTVAVQPGVEVADLVGVAALTLAGALRGDSVAAPAVEGDDVDADVVGGVLAPEPALRGLRLVRHWSIPRSWGWGYETFGSDLETAGARKGGRSRYRQPPRGRSHHRRQRYLVCRPEGSL